MILRPRFARESVHNVIVSHYAATPAESPKSERARHQSRLLGQNENNLNAQTRIALRKAKDNGLRTRDRRNES
jgi:hypothetical protein